MLVSSPRLPIWAFLENLLTLVQAFSLLENPGNMPNQAIASDPPFHDIFVPRNIPFSKISNDVITRNLRFAPPNVHTPIKNSGHACGVLSVVILTVLLAKALFKKTMQKNNKWFDGY